MTACLPILPFYYVLRSEARTREAAMAHASVKSSTSVRLEASHCRRRREEAASRTVGTLAAPEFSVGRRLGFAERNGLVELRTDARERTMDDDVAFSGHHDPFFRDDETVALAAAPLARGVAVTAARNPAVVSQSIRNDDDEGRKGEREPGKASEHGSIPFRCPGAAINQVNAKLLGFLIAPVAGGSACTRSPIYAHPSGRIAAPQQANQPLDLEL